MNDRSSQVIELTQSLVRIDSRNTRPIEFDGPREADEEQMAAFLENFLHQRGFTVARQYAAPRRPNLVAFRDDANPAWPTLAFQAHMDTVGTEGMTIEPFVPEVRDGRLYGRGACDTKGSMAAMLVAMDRLLARGAAINLMFLASCSEETGCQGSPQMDLSAWSIDGIIVGEPTSNRPIIAHKAQGSFELSCAGRAAHGARPELGCNAIYRALDFVALLRNEVIPALARHRADGFSGSTLSVNMIQGGVKSNIVPDRCTFVIDLRVVPGYGDPAVVMRNIVEEAEKKLGFDVDITWEHGTPELMTPPECPLVQAVRAALRNQSLEDVPGTVSYCTDAGVFARMGCDCVILGPGDIRQAHGAIEYVPVAQLDQAVDIYTAAAEALAALPR